MPAAFARPIINKEREGGDEREPGAQPRRLADHVLLGARPVLDRSLSGRREDRQVIRKITDTATDPHFESLQFLSSAGAWDRDEQAVRVPRDQPEDSRCSRSWTPTAASRSARSRLKELDEVLNPGLVARRQPDRVLGPGRRVQRSVRLRPGQRAAAPADQRCVRRARSGVVARRQAAGVQHRPVHDQPARARGRQPAARGHGRGVRRASAKPAGSTTPRTSARSGRATAGRCTSSPTAAASRNIYRAPLDGGTPTQLTNILTGVERHHRTQPGAVGRRMVASCSAPTRTDGYNVYALDTEQAARRRRRSSICR